jgi:hypothetical protein
MFLLWPGWKWLQGHLEFTEGGMAKQLCKAFMAGMVPSRDGIVSQQQEVVFAI